MRLKLPKFALWLSLALVAWFLVAVFGPKFGLIDWQTGLVTMIFRAGVPLVAVTSLVALIALIAALFKAPRSGWWKAALALAIPLAILAGLASVRTQGEAVPAIHDVATNVGDPPMFSERVMALREEAGANPISDYAVPLGEMEAWKERMAGTPLASQNHAEIILESYGDIKPIAFSGDLAVATLAVQSAMEELGFTQVTISDASPVPEPSAGTEEEQPAENERAAVVLVEGVAETFLFGFKDDVVVRIEGGQIDMRSVSRVGLSDLGVNADRLRELRLAIEAGLER